ncbi:MAG: beta-ketoacyl synthase N-terminal-like domain-containing protein, partial [Balneolaceae bacterium]
MDEKTSGSWSNLVELLQLRAETTPDSMAYTFLKDGIEEATVYTYAELDRQARAVAATLGDVAGERALLIYPPGAEFVAGFFGTLYAGAIPIPAPPPDIARLKRTLPRLRSIILDADASLMVTTSDISESLLGVIDETLEFPQLTWLGTDTVELTMADKWEGPPDIDENDVAYLQYTSGSTSTPKGVMITHKNVKANSAVIYQGFGYDSESVEVTWMPYFHDYGLVDGLLQPLYNGIPCYILSPLTFLRRPERWLEVISRVRGTHTQAPNFAYEQCVRRIDDELLPTLDLSCMKTASSGGEPIRTETVQGFRDKFAVCGLKPEAVCPAYGLAEATLLVSAKTRTGPPVFSSVDAEAYKNDCIIEVLPDDPAVRSRTVTSSGIILDNMDVAIVEGESEQCLPDGVIGEVWVGGDSIGAGYWQHPEESERTFRARLSDDPSRGPFLRTGDLGFVLRNNLYITGRKKDLIIIAGVNHYPQDIEYTVQEADDAIRTDHCVAFSVDVDGEERLVVVAEAAKNLKDWEPLLTTMRKVISENHEVDLYALQLIRRGTILKTSSGKLRRSGCRNAFLKDKFETRYTWRKESKKPVASEPKKVSSGTTSTEEQTRITGHSIRRHEIEQWLTSRVADQLSLPESSIDVNRPLAEVGLTSRAAVSIVGQLEVWLGIKELSSTLLWEYPTIASLSRHLEAGESLSEEAQKEGAEKRATAVRNPEGQQSAPEQQKTAAEPLAIVGISCRFPQAGNPEAFWELLLRGGDAVTEVPEDRWKSTDYFSEESGKSGFMNNRDGGFLNDVDKFDAAFFDISPAEAEMMDPQQRLLLELAWESFESAGIDPSGAAGADCGVFIGISTNDYADLQMADRFRMNPYTGPGKSYSIAANRISYLFNLQGPSMAIDTACSSSLVALHQARQALQNGDCQMSLVGGVNLLLSPKMSVALAQAGMLSSKGRCSPFDASADGYVRSEGGGMVVLKRLSEAQKDGDRIYAVLRGSAINQDGRSNGLTAPNGLAQQAVVQRAIADSGLTPDRIRYVEAHGTGTPLGDPIEIRSLQNVLGEGRADDRICTIGSVKSNLGHLEAAAGIAGLIKVALSLWHRQIPANSNFTKLNELIRLKDTPFAIADKLQPWAEDERFAGVSSFGFGGTNAHAILSSAPVGVSVAVADSVSVNGHGEKAAQSAGSNGQGENQAQPTASNGKARPGEENADTPERYILPISARTSRSLSLLADRYREQLVSDEKATIGDICYSAAVTRRGFEHRLVITGSDKEDIAGELKRFADGETGGWILSSNGNERHKTAWLFTGQGSQYTGMGQELYESEPQFKKEIDRCNRVLKPLLGISLPDLLWDEANREKLGQTRYTQPALFALQTSLAQWLMSRGVIPDAVMGHSVGDFAAACVAGIISVEDGLLLTAERGRLVQEHGLEGVMAAVKTDAKTAAGIVENIEGVEMATLNGPAGQVVAGSPESVKRAIEKFESAGIESRILNVSHAFHTALMDPALAPFAEVAGKVTWRPAVIPILSNLSGSFGGDEMSSAGYWVEHLRKPVLFGQGMQHLLEENFDTFVEVGPKPVLLGMAGQFDNTGGCHWVSTLRHGESDRDQLFTAVGKLWSLGAKINWKAFYGNASVRRTELPSYPFDRRRYWLDADKGSGTDKGWAAPEKISVREGTLLGEKVESPLMPVTLFQSVFSLKKLPFYGEHRVFGEVVVPAAGHMSLLLQAAKALYGKPGCRIRDLIFPQPLIIPDDDEKRVELGVEHADTEGEQPLRLISWSPQQRQSNGPGFGSGANVVHSEHVRGSIRPAVGDTPPDTSTLEEVQRRCEKKEQADFYEVIWQNHIQLGDGFRRIKSLYHGKGEVLVELHLSSRTASGYSSTQTATGDDPGLPPGLFDSTLQGVTALVELDDDQAMVPFSVDELDYYGRSATAEAVMWSHIRLRETAGDTAVSDVRIFETTGDGKGRVVAEVRGFRVRKVGMVQLLRDLNRDYHDHLYHIEWEKADTLPPLKESRSGRWLCWMDKKDTTSSGKDNANQINGRTIGRSIPEGVHNGVDVTSLQELEAELKRGDVAGILFGLGAGLNGPAQGDKLEPVVTSLMTTLEIIDEQPVPLVILTSGAQTLDDQGTCEPL